MQQLKEKIIIKCKGTPILGSVCSFAHDHAILKMVEVLGSLQKRNASDRIDCLTFSVNDISCGGNGKLPVEYCEAEVEFILSDETKNENLSHMLDDAIAQIGYQGITYEIVTDKSAMNEVGLK